MQEKRKLIKVEHFYIDKGPNTEKLNWLSNHLIAILQQNQWNIIRNRKIAAEENLLTVEM